MAKSNVCKDFLKASQKGDLTILKDLTTKNNVSDWTIYRHEISGDTALHLATREGHLNVVKFLCESWIDPSFKTEVTNRDSKRPLHDAAQFARHDVLKYLLDQGTSVDPLKRADWTPLMLACTKTGWEASRCVDILLKHGAVINLQNKDGWTPLLIACRTGNIEVIRTLINHSPQIIYAISKNGRSPLHIAAFHGHIDVIDLLLSKDSDLIDRQDSSGSTPLLESIKSGDINTIEYLIKSEANVKAVDKVGQNILHIAAQSGNVKIIKFILENQLIDVNSEASLGITPLALAEKNKQDEAIKILKYFNKF